MSRVGRAARWGALVATALATGAIGSFLLLTRTQAGQTMVLAEVLRRVESGLEGGMRVGALRSAEGLHRSATFVDVELRAADGATVFTADSVSTRYSVGDLVGGDWTFTDVELWGPTVTLVRPEPGSSYSIESLLPPPDSTGRPGPIRIVFEDIGVHDGRVEVHHPLAEDDEPGAGVRVERPLGGAGLTRRMTFAEIGGRLRRVGVLDPSRGGIHVDVANLAMIGEVSSEPIVLREFRGDLAYDSSRLSITIERARLPGTEMAGITTIDWFEDSGPSVRMDFTVPELTLSDLDWTLPDIPDAIGATAFGLELDDDGLRVRLDGSRLQFADGRVEGGAILTWTPGAEYPVLRDVELRLDGVASAIAEQIVPVEMPFGGYLDGSLTLEGPLLTPSLEGTLVHRRSDLLQSEVDVEGRLRLGDDPGADDLVMAFRQLSLGVIDAYTTGLDVSRVLQGTLTLDGTMSAGLRVGLDASYPSPEGEPTAVSLDGSISRVAEEVFLDLEGSADPIWFPGLVREGSLLAHLGRATGALRVRGPLTDLAVEVDLEMPGGALGLVTRLDARNPLHAYRVNATANRFDPAALLPELPDGTAFSGMAELTGGGGGLDEGRLDARLALFDSKLAKLAVDTATVSGSIEQGLIRIDDLEAVIGRTAVSGSGTLGTSRTATPGRLVLDFENHDLEGLRPLLLGENVIARDSLTTLDREILALDGIDADTLPLLRDVAAGGTLSGRVMLEGALDSLSLSGSFVADSARYGTSFVENAEVEFNATGLPSVRPRIEALVETGPVRLLERAFDSASVRLDYRDPRGGMDVFLVRSDDEDYRARVNFEWAEDQRILNLDEMLLRFADTRWNLGGPATIAWDADGLTFDDLRVIRPGSGGLRLSAEGRLPFRGEANLDVSIERLDLARVAHALQLQEQLDGMVSLDLQVGGTAASPTMEGDLRARAFRFREYQLDSLEAELTYDDRRVTGDSEIWRGEREVLNVRGAMPADLAFRAVESRFPDEAVDLTVVVDSLPVSLLMAPIQAYTNVVGALTGSVTLGGTLQHLAPDGEIRVDGAGAFIEDIGVRHQDLDAVLDLHPDGTVEVTGSVEARGRAEVTGSIRLSPLSDFALDLGVQLDNFLAIDRRDVRALLSGEFRVDGSYQSPVVSGDLDVDEGELFVEEFMRVTDIVDLADSTLLSVVDTSIVDLRPLIAGANPFLRNIRMENMRLGFESNSWVRSENMNIELGGELDVLYDRGLQEIALLGTLNALRGTYTAFGRGFNVDEGTLRFIGLPGINPDLDFVATNRIRTLERDALEITANVTGTLITPRVDLTSDRPGLSPDDLISYMYFGRPTYALTAGQTQALGAAGTLLVGSGVTLGLQSFSNALGAAASDLGFAYLSITQQDLGAFQNNLSLGSTLVLETGRYVTDDFFLTLLLKPLSAQGAGSQFGGLRLEWATLNAYTLEAFVEERFFRGRVLGFGEFGVEDQLGFGLFFFREWGY